MSAPKLTAGMRKALVAASSGQLGSWDAEAGVLGALKKRGWVVRQANGSYLATESGVDALLNEKGDIK